VVSALAVLAVFGAACGSDGGGGGSSDGDTEDADYLEGGMFTVVENADPANLDPHLSISGAAISASVYAYDTLIRIDADGKVLPSLATDWTESPTDVTYTLRDGVTCSDGTPLTASVVADNFRYVADPANESPLLGLNVPEGITAEADDDAGTVTLTSAEPVPFFLQSTGGLFIVCAAGLADRGLLERGTSGTGPFVLTDAVPDDHYTYEARDDYAWGPDGASSDVPGFPAELVIRIVPNESTAANLLLSGEVNAATVIGPDRQRLDAEGLFKVDRRGIVGEFVFNQSDGLPLADVEVRRALARALDLDEMASVFTGGSGSVPHGVVDTTSQLCPGDTMDSVLGDGADPDEAARMLDDAGWTLDADGKRSKDGEPLSVRLVYANFALEGAGATMELVKSIWEDLGASVEILAAEQSQVTELLLSSRAWDVMALNINVDTPSFLVPLVSGPAPPEGQNLGDASNSRYDELVDEARSLTGDAACAKWLEAETALLDAMNLLPFATGVTPTYGRDAQFEVSSQGVEASSIRLLQP
jgi:peptide/nickel transport system substrate-binding protein